MGHFKSVLLLCVWMAAAAPAAGDDPLATALTSLTFMNEGVVQSTDVFTYRGFPCRHLEPDNATTPHFPWSTGSTCQYLYMEQPAPGTCGSSVLNDTDFAGTNTDSFEVASNNVTACSSACCQDPNCAGWTFTVAPTDFEQCTKGSFCCYKKSSVSSQSSRPDTLSGYTSATQVVHPPVGVRNAVPVGAVGGGFFELRATGRFHEWNTANESPACAVKIPVFDDMFAAVKVGEAAAALRTHPPQGVDGVAALKYSGAHPVSRLTADDPNVSATLFAYSTYRPGNLASSSRPAAALSFVLTNPSTTENTSVSALVTLPHAIEPDTTRSFQSVVVGNTSAATPLDCRTQCMASPKCMAWSLAAPPSTTCTQYGNMSLNAYAAGVTSGVRSSWVQEASCLTLSRPGAFPSSGNMSLCADGPGTSVSFGTANSVADLYTAFKSGGDLSTVAGLNGVVGGATISATLAPGETRTVSIVLAWYHPHLTFMNVDIGRRYATMWSSSAEVGRDMLAELPAVVSDIAAMHSVFTNTSVPEWLSDFTLQSLSHVRNSMWVRDGRYFAYETFDSHNVDSIHNDGERSMIYLTMFPDTVRYKLAEWASQQQANGMMMEQLSSHYKDGYSPLGVGVGRVMGDVTSAWFGNYIYTLWKNGNDTELLSKWWPTIVRAARWQNSTTADYGLPYMLQTTYDVLGMEKYPTCTYNGVFHLLAMRAAADMAVAVGDHDTAAWCNASFHRAQAALDHYLWVSSPDGADAFWAGWFTKDSQAQALMTDALYGQVVAYTAGMGTLVSSDAKVGSYLKAVLKYASTPIGTMVVVDPLSTVTKMPATSGDVWQMTPNNIATLGLRSGTLGVEEALAQANATIGLWRDTLRSLWDIAGLSGGPSNAAAGLPTDTSHYGYAYTCWHVILALAGQVADLPAGRLSFDPPAGVSSPFRYPVLLPAVLGTISGDGKGTYTLDLAVGGPLTLSDLSVAGAKHDGTVEAAVGKPVSWSAGSLA